MRAKNTTRRRPIKSAAGHIQINADVLNAKLPPLDWVKQTYGQPATMSAPPADVQVALDSAIAPVHTMLQRAIGMCGDYDAFPHFLGYGVLLSLSQDGLIRAGVEMMADEMTGKWIRLSRASKKDEDSNGLPDLEEDLKTFKIQTVFRRAVANCGYFGGSLVYIDTGEQDLTAPLVLTAQTFTKGCLRGFKVIEPFNLSPGVYNSTDPIAPNYYSPSVWYVQGRPIHASRFLYFSMTTLASLLLPAYNFFGIPLAQIVLDAVSHFTQCREAEARLLTKFSLLMMKTDMDEILSGGAATMLDRRVQYLAQQRDNDSVVVVDKEKEDIVSITTPLSGVTDIVRQSMEMVAAYFNEPVTKMWGLSPSGFNPTGESDMQNHHDRIGSLQDKIMAEPLLKVLQILQLNRCGSIDQSVSCSFQKLSQDDEQKAASVRKTNAETANLYIDAGVISAEEERARIASDPDSGYDDIAPYEMPDVPEDENEEDLAEEMTLLDGLAQDDDAEWITTKGGHRCLLGEGGEVKAGMGGKFNGKNISDVGGNEKNGGHATTAAEKQKKIDSVKIDFSKDNTLPGLNKEDLDELGKEDKPVLLKKNIIERNEKQHTDISREEFQKILGEALYTPDVIIPEKNPLKSNYHHFVKYLERDNSIVLLEMSESKEDYEIVHVQKMNSKNTERLKRNKK